MAEHDDLAAFLALFFAELVPPGFIEVRIIAEKGTESKYRKQHWFESVPQLVGQLDALKAEAEQHSAAVYFGVLPRVRKSGRKRDLSVGRIVWADLDYEQYDGSTPAEREQAARSHLFNFPLPPSAVVRSGHGLHAYWALDDQVSADACSVLAKRIELALRSDHVSDAPRIMRLPFTVNRKHNDATLVELEQLHEEDTYEPSEIESFTPEPPPTRAPSSGDGPAVTRAAPPVEAKLPEAVAELFKASRTLAELYVGRGKQSGDTSTSGYDMSFAVQLVKKGITDPDVLAQAVASRPDTKANEKGPRYIHDTVAKALESRPKPKVRHDDSVPVTRAGQQGALWAVDFTVERVVVYTSNPPVYELTIDGRVLKLSSEELLRVSRFELRFFEAFNRMTKLPGPKQKEAWRDLVNGWLAQAEEIEQPPEASREYQLREAIEDVVTDMQVGSDLADLDRDRALLTEDGRKAFKTKTLMKALRQNFRDIGGHTVTATMRSMGFDSSRHRWDGSQVRVWVCAEPSTNGKHPEPAQDDDVPF